MPKIMMRNLTSTLTALTLILGTGTFAATVFTAETAFAKSENGKGKGQEKSKDSKSDKGKSKSSEKSKGKSSKSEKRSSGGSKSASSRSAGYKSSTNTSFADLGNEFKRDVGRLFGRKETERRVSTSGKTTKTQRKTVSKRVVAPLEESPRPAVRQRAVRTETVIARSGPEPVRDPLVRRITSADGSDNLKNLNAAGASSQAFENASANSNIGKIETYRQSAETYFGLRDDLHTTRQTRRALDRSYDGRSTEEIRADLSLLDPEDPNYEADLEALTAEFRDARIYDVKHDVLTRQIAKLHRETGQALETAEADFFDASKGRSLTPAALEELHADLGLPGPIGQETDAGEVVAYRATRDVEIVKAAYLPEETDTDPDPEFARPTPGRPIVPNPLVVSITDPDGSDNLRNLNASGASEQAFANAAANSNIGQIETYRQSAETYFDLRQDLLITRRARHALDDLYDGRSSDEILDEIAGLEITDPDYETRLGELEAEFDQAVAYEETRDDLDGALRRLRRETVLASKEAEAAFYDASKGETLSPQALTELHENLDLPTPSR